MGSPSPPDWSHRLSDVSLLWRSLDPQLWRQRPSPPLAILLYAQPFSGSTVVADCLAQLPGLAGIGPSYELQWRFASLSDERRWQPERRYRHIRGIRSVLESSARQAGLRGVVEKSPPNCLRVAAVRQWFAGFQCLELVLTRHPLAQWSSACQRHWRDGRRYPSWMASWEPCLARVPQELAQIIQCHALTFELQLLGLWLLRAELLKQQMGKQPLMHWRYEDFTERPQQFITPLARALDLVPGAASGTFTVRVKGGATAVISNRNQQQLAAMPSEIVQAGLRLLHEEPVVALLKHWGYQPSFAPDA